ncbi:SpaA isopeptide-forming pilin-related protein [Fundicoccus sp. Sow4_H7]|uniref:SpaA isopeptide-forming pilin-related protein n=1 Tax=Fundicoccus sp. Sow4_H7 TaxID=3438784 RepID=UPI003F8D928E
MKLKRIAKHLLISSLLVTSQLSGLVTAFAQDGVEVDIDVFLQTQMNQPSEQTQISYDIIDTNLSQVVYSYRSNDVPTDVLELAPGNYVLRIYDAQGFVRDGENISAYQIEQSIAELTQEDINAGKELKELNNLGSINTLADGTVVYDIPFEIVTGPDLLDEASQKMISELDILLTDQTAASLLDQEEESTVPEETSQVGAFEVRVLDQNDAPVPNVVLSLGDQSLQTDENGLAKINELVAGNYQLTVTELPAGFVGDYAANLDIVANEISQVTIRLESQPQSSGIQFKIHDQNQEVVPNAEIVVGDQIITTNEEGIATISDLILGDYYYAISSLPKGYAGWAEGTITVVADYISEITIGVERQAQTSQAEIRVLDQNDMPISGVEIVLADQLVATNENGVAVFNDIPLGEHYYYVNAVPEGYTGSFEGNLNVTSEEVASVAQSLESIPQTNSVEFVAVDQHSSVVPGVEITIGEQVIQTDENGHATVYELPVGDYNYSVTGLPEGFSGSNEGVVSVTTEESPIVTLSIVREAQTTQAEVTVVDQDGNPIPNVEVVLAELTATTNENGVAVFNEIPLGELYYYVNNLPEGYSGEGNGVVYAESDQIATATITLERAPQTTTVTLSILDQNDNPVTGVEILMNEQTVTSNDEGKVVFENVPAGTHEYTVASLPEYYEVDTTGYSITVPENEPATGTVYVTYVEQIGNVEFKVTDQDGSAVPNAEITVAEQVITTNENGLATIEGLELGDYNYTLSSLPEGYSGNAEGAVTVTNEAVAQVDLQVERAPQTTTVTLSILDQNDNPVSGVEILMNNQTIASNDEGKVVFENVPAGTHEYTVASLPEYYEVDTTGYSITVPENEPATGTIFVNYEEPTGVVEFIVKDQDGKAVANAVIQLANQEITTNGEGIATLADLPLGADYNYQLVSLPEGYTGQASDVVSPNNEATTTVAINVTRTVEAGVFTLVVNDQNAEPVSGVVVRLGEQTATTDENGHAVFNEVTPATYEYQITELPDGYQSDRPVNNIVIGEGAQETRTLEVMRDIQQRTIQFFLVDQNEEAISGVDITIVDRSGMTNDEGRVSFGEMNPGNYDYTLSNVPDNYSGQLTGAVELTEAEDATITITLEREIELATARVQVLDQDDKAVVNAVVKFGGLQETTNEDGWVQFNSLEPGNYYYEVLEAPNNYVLSGEELRAEIEEGMAFEGRLNIERRLFGQVNITITDDQNRPVPNAVVKINNQEVRTNNDGIASFTELEPGDYSYEIVDLPEQYEIANRTATVTVEADKTVDQAITVTIRPESSESESVSSSEESVSESSSESESVSSSEESASESSSESISEESVDESEAEEATRRYVDDETGIEVWINPEDAPNVVRLQTSRVSTLDPLPSALNGKAYKVYDIQLLDRQNNPVQLTRVAEIRIPVGQVRSQIQVLRINGANVSNLTNSVHNQNVTIRTQQLGRFAVVTGNAPVESSSESTIDSSSNESLTSEEESESLSRRVSISKSVEENLPNTGEIKSLRYITLAVVLVAIGLKMILSNLSGKNKE